MPKKTKEQNELEKKKTTAKKESSKTSKKVASKEKKVTAKKTEKKSTSTKKTVTTKKASDSKKSDSSKVARTSTKKATTTKKKEATKKKIEIVEYYDLPDRYNQTLVKVLAQTPKTLFIYWEISENDREHYRKQYGENFFETTKPVLIIHNDTLGYQFEIEINDFANSWYLHVADSKCDYRIELGRRPIVKTENLNADYIYISMSNGIESPNDKILFDKNQNMVYFKNVQTGEQTAKDASTLSFLRNMGKIYNIYDFYKTIYGDENIYDLSNPSSGNPSSGSLSSKFK